MMKCKINIKHKTAVVACGGSDIDLVSEIAYMIRSVYRDLRQREPEMAKTYRYQLTALLVSPESPIWKEK